VEDASTWTISESRNVSPAVDVVGVKVSNLIGDGVDAYDLELTSINIEAPRRAYFCLGLGRYA
jgi:hypothetical protein